MPSAHVRSHELEHLAHILVAKRTKHAMELLIRIILVKRLDQATNRVGIVSAI